MRAVNCKHGRKDTLLAARSSCLKAFAAGAAFRVVIAGIAHVNFSQRAVIPRAIVLTFRHAATDAGVYFLYVFVHNNKNPPFLVPIVLFRIYSISNL